MANPKITVILMGAVEGEEDMVFLITGSDGTRLGDVIKAGEGDWEKSTYPSGDLSYYATLEDAIRSFF